MSREQLERALSAIEDLTDKSKVFAKATEAANLVAYTYLSTVTEAVALLTSMHEELPTLAALQALTMSARGPLASRQDAVTCLGPALRFSFACCGHANKTIADEAQECSSALCKVLVPVELTICLESLVSTCDDVFKPSLLLSISTALPGSVAALRMVMKAQVKAPRELAACLPALIPRLVLCLMSVNQGVTTLAKKAMNCALSVVNNNDIAPLLTNYMGYIVNPTYMPDLMHMLDGITFVQTIDSPTVAVLVPLLACGLREEHNNELAVQRTIVDVVNQIFQLMSDPFVQVPLFLPLLPGLEAAASNGDLDVESRSICDAILQQLLPVHTMEVATKEIVDAAKSGNEDLVKKCIANKAKIDECTDERGFTTLIWASYKGYTAIVQLLMEAGADIEIKSLNGWTALVWAAQEGHIDVVKLHLAAGTLKTAKNNALISAATHDHTEILNLLLKNGADKNAPNKRGRTPLHESAALGHVDTMKALIVAGADVSIHDKNDATPLDLATHGCSCHALLEKHVHICAALRNAPTSVETHAVAYCANLPSMLDARNFPMTAPGGWAVHVHPSFAWAPGGAQYMVFAWAQDAFELQFAATTQPCVDLPDDCIGDVLEFIHARMTRAEYMYVATHCSSPEAQAWVRSVVAAAVAMKATHDLEPALREGNASRVKECLSRGADVDSYLWGRTALIYASYHGYTEIVQLLLEAGANTEIRDDLSASSFDGGTALMQAIAKCHIESVKLLLEAGANPETKDSDGNTALINVCKKGRPGYVKLLVDAGANKEAKDKCGCTPLALATMYNHLPAVAVLLRAGAYTGARDQDGNSVLLCASWSGSDPIVLKALLEASTFGNTSALANTRIEDCNEVLLKSVEKGYTGIVQVFFKAGISVKATDEIGVRALIKAALYNRVDIVTLLLEAGCDINAKDERQNSTALMMASDEGHDAVVKLLLEAGADKDAKDKIGETALMRAADEGRTSTVELLLKAGAAKDAQSECGDTALINASISGYIAVVKVLLEAGVDTDAQDSDGETAIFKSSKLSSNFVLKLLLEVGADVNIRNKNGDTVLTLASMRGDTAIVEDLLLAGVDVSVRSNNGRTALMNASEAGHIAVVKLLLKAGADKDAQDEDGSTALMYASFHGYSIVVSLLLRRKKADVNVKNNRGNTALDYANASKVRRKGTVKQLLKAGAKVVKT